jgi:acetate kinase
VRARALSGLAWAGAVLDPTLNDAARGGEARLSPPQAAVRVHVIPGDEELVLARAAAALLLT